MIIQNSIDAERFVVLYMPQRKPIYADYLLKHGRESRSLIIEQVCAKTGITAKKYQLMEAGLSIINKTDAELLGVLFKINLQYIEAHNFQLTLLTGSRMKNQ